MALKDPKARRAYTRRWYAQNKERILVERRAYQKANPEKVARWKRTNSARYGDFYRVRKLAKRYGISESRVRELDALQDCPICSRPATDIDHSHHTGIVRGKLCSRCNKGLGLFLDSPELLRTAANYLEETCE